MDVRFDLGWFIPLAILLFSFSYVFFMALQGIAKRAGDYITLYRTYYRHKDEVERYIEELKRSAERK